MNTYQAKKTTEKGRLGEQIAQKFLMKRGYKLLKKNFHIQGGEIDLIMKKGETVVFVEVKLRSSKAFGGGIESITWTKKQKLLRAISVFLEHERKNRILKIFTPFMNNGIAWNLDVVDIFYDYKTKTASIDHIPNIFEL